MEVCGHTVMFIGAGIKRCYPPSNRRLQQSIEEHGLVESLILTG